MSCLTNLRAHSSEKLRLLCPLAGWLEEFSSLQHSAGGLTNLSRRKCLTWSKAGWRLFYNPCKRDFCFEASFHRVLDASAHIYWTARPWHHERFHQSSKLILGMSIALEMCIFKHHWVGAMTSLPGQHYRCPQATTNLDRLQSCLQPLLGSTAPRVLNSRICKILFSLMCSRSI